VTHLFGISHRERCRSVSWSTVAKTAKGLGLFAESTSISTLWLSSGCFSGIVLLLFYGICAKQGQQRCKGLRAGVWLALHTHKRHRLLTLLAGSWVQLVRSHHSQPCAHSVPRRCRGPTGPALFLTGQRGSVRSEYTTTSSSSSPAGRRGRGLYLQCYCSQCHQLALNL